MNYDLNDIEYVKAVVLSGVKADINVQVQIKLKSAVDTENIQVKLVSNKRGFNQVDKRWLDHYKEMWEMPDDAYEILQYFTGEKAPYKVNTKDNRRMFLNEMEQDKQDIILKWFSENKTLILSDIIKGRGQFSAEWFLVAQKVEINSRWVLRNINEVLQHYANDDVELSTIRLRGSWYNWWKDLAEDEFCLNNYQEVNVMDNTALFNLTYGLFLLTANNDGKDNGCIVNTAIQVANDPTRISIAVIKQNKTCEMILNSGKFNVSSVTEGADFDLFTRFGMQSGRDVDKFDGFADVARSENGLYYLTKNANMYLSAVVTQHIDLDSHILFIGEVTDGVNLEKAPSCTYSYYHNNIKPKPQAVKKKQWVCSICGYVYEGDEVPEDYLCPLCNHGKDFFTLAEGEAPAQSEESVKWVCSVCGYVHEGDTPPEVCPLCKQPADKFNKA